MADYSFVPHFPGVAVEDGRQPQDRPSQEVSTNWQTAPDDHFQFENLPEYQLPEYAYNDCGSVYGGTPMYDPQLYPRQAYGPTSHTGIYLTPPAQQGGSFMQGYGGYAGSMPGQQAPGHPVDLRRQVLQMNMPTNDGSSQGMFGIFDQREATPPSPTPTKALPAHNGGPTKIIHSCDPEDVEMVTRFKIGQTMNKTGTKLTKRVKVPRRGGQTEEMWRCNKISCETCRSTETKSHLTEAVAQTHGLSGLPLLQRYPRKKVQKEADQPHPAQAAGTPGEVPHFTSSTSAGPVMTDVMPQGVAGGAEGRVEENTAHLQGRAVGGYHAAMSHKQAEMLDNVLTDQAVRSTAQPDADQNGGRPMSNDIQPTASTARADRWAQDLGLTEEQMRYILTQCQPINAGMGAPSEDSTS